MESCNIQSQDHDVVLILRKSQAKKSGAGIQDNLDPGIKVIEVSHFWRTQSRIQKLLSELQPDVVHAHLRKSTRILSRCATNAVKVSTLHLGINGRAFLDMDALIAISPWQLEHIPKQYNGIVKWIRNSLKPGSKPSTQQIQKLRASICDDKHLLIGGVGRLSFSKGWDILIQAFKQANLPNCTLVIIGEGSLEKKLRKLAEGSEIKFLGFKNDIKNYYPAFDLLVCPSREEPMGRVILEALDAGTPVIASNIEGPNDILSEFPGTLFKSGNTSELQKALELAHAEKPARVNVDLSSHFAETVNAEIVNLYLETINRRR